MDRTADRDEHLGAYRRAIHLRSNGDVAAAAMEDDVHHFAVALRHDGERITAVDAEAIRTPWSMCPHAVGQLKTLEGLALEDVRTLSAGARAEHCLHLFDLALLAASHARDAGFDRLYRIEADHDVRPMLVRLWRDGVEVSSWGVDGGVVRGGRFDATRLAQLHERFSGLDADEIEAALVLRRASLISFVRARDLDAVATLADGSPPTPANCYAKQPGRRELAQRNFGTTRDFSGTGRWPLAR